MTDIRRLMINAGLDPKSYEEIIEQQADDADEATEVKEDETFLEGKTKASVNCSASLVFSTSNKTPCTAQLDTGRSLGIFNHT